MKSPLFLGVLLLSVWAVHPLHAQRAQAAKSPSIIPADISVLLGKNACAACHKPTLRVVGPAFVAVAKRGYPTAQLGQLIRQPEPKNWPGYPPMPPQPQLPEADAQKLAAWINSLRN